VPNTGFILLVSMYIIRSNGNLFGIMFALFNKMDTIFKIIYPLLMKINTLFVLMYKLERLV